MDASRNRGRGRVLVVDDDQLILNATARLFKHVGYEVTGYTLPEEALAVFKAEPISIVPPSIANIPPTASHTSSRGWASGNGT